MTGTEAARARLRALVERKSLKKGGPFTLASGATSNYYFNLKETVLDPEGSLLIADLILGSLEGTKVDCIGGLEMGAVPLAACAALRSGQIGRPLMAFYVRKEAKRHGAKKRIDVELPAGGRAVILEDVTTTGGSALQAIEAVRELGLTADVVVTVLDRGEGAVESLKAKGITLIPLLRAADFDLR